MSGPPLRLVTASPHLGSGHSTQRIMWTVVASLVPVMATSVWFFGPSALLVTSAATAGVLVTERVFGARHSLLDGSGMITGILLGLTLPAGLPMWMAFVGGAFAIGFGKLVFGGLGQNVFNPALLGRAFLQAAFPVAMTTWPAAQASWWQLRGDNLALPLMSARAPDVMLLPCHARWRHRSQHGRERSDVPFGDPSGELEQVGIEIAHGRHDFADREHPCRQVVRRTEDPAACQRAVEPEAHVRADTRMQVGGQVVGERLVEGEQRAVDADRDRPGENLRRRRRFGARRCDRWPPRGTPCGRSGRRQPSRRRSGVRGPDRG